MKRCAPVFETVIKEEEDEANKAGLASLNEYEKNLIIPPLVKEEDSFNYGTTFMFFRDDDVCAEQNREKIIFFYEELEEIGIPTVTDLLKKIGDHNDMLAYSSAKALKNTRFIYNVVRDNSNIMNIKNKNEDLAIEIIIEFLESNYLFTNLLTKESMVTFIVRTLVDNNRLFEFDSYYSHEEENTRIFYNPSKNSIVDIFGNFGQNKENTRHFINNCPKNMSRLVRVDFNRDFDLISRILNRMEVEVY